MTSMARPPAVTPSPTALERLPIVGQILSVAPRMREHLGDCTARERAALALRDDCPQEVLALMADDLPTVVRAVVGNANCPPHVVESVIGRIEKHEKRDYWLYQETLESALANPNCPDHLLRARFPEHWRSILGNSSCPFDLLRGASLSESAPLRCRAAGDPRLPEGDLLRLVQDSNPDVAWRALLAVRRRDVATIRAALGSVRGQGRRWIMEDLPSAKLRALAADPDPWIRRGVARVAASHTLLGRLADDPNGHVRRAASQRLMELVAA